jgi:hypothetical protein
LKRAAAFFIAAVTILFVSLVLTGGGSILIAGIVAVLAGLAFAALPEEGMAIVGFLACIPVVVVQAAVGLPSVALWLAVCGAVVLAPPVVGFVGFMETRQRLGDPAAVFFLIIFLTVWLAARRWHRTTITNTAREMSDFIRPFNKPLENVRAGLYKYFEDVGKWMTQ